MLAARWMHKCTTPKEILHLMLNFQFVQRDIDPNRSADLLNLKIPLLFDLALPLEAKGLVDVEFPDNGEDGSEDGDTHDDD